MADTLFPDIPTQEPPTHRQTDSHVLIQCPNCKGEGTTPHHGWDLTCRVCDGAGWQMRRNP